MTRAWYTWGLGINSGDAVHNMVSGHHPGTIADRRQTAQENATFQAKSIEAGKAAFQVGNCKLALTHFGEALHALQDTFSHRVLKGNRLWGLPILNSEHIGNFWDPFADGYDNPKFMPWRYTSAQMATNPIIATIKAMAGCCCSQPRLNLQQPPVATLCDPLKDPPHISCCPLMTKPGSTPPSPGSTVGF